MKNLLYITLLSLILISCDRFKVDSDKIQISSSDFEKLEKLPEFQLIDLDSINNFGELRTEMGKVTCDMKISGLKFQYQDTIYKTIASADCPTSNEISCYFRKNIIIIKNDSLVPDLRNRNKRIPIENLKNVLTDISSIPYNFEYDKGILKAALIHIYIEEKYPISKTKKVLKEIVEQFENINSGKKTDYFKYIILIEQFDLSNIPPPPPKENS